VGFPENVLISEERVVMHLHPHWKAMVRPVAILIVILAAIISTWIFLNSNILLLVVAALGLIAFIVFCLWPFMKWRTTHYVFTTERIIMREGVFSRDGRDIPLDRVNDVSFHHSFFERLLGTGVLVIESAGEHGQVALKEIPHVERVQSQLYQLVDDDTENRNERPRQRGDSDASDSRDGDTKTLRK
jgi:uncharacterized membrane protein YdbT with pleckstrin-like domain